MSISHRDRLQNEIQSDLERERKSFGSPDEVRRASFYEPSPGQTWGHVDHRVTMVAMRHVSPLGPGSPPKLDEHLTYEYQCTTRAELRAMVDKLLAADTCFAVIGGEMKLRFHDRGAEALGMAV